MNDQDQSPSLGDTYIGQGEFQLKNVHVHATVEVQSGQIRRVEFKASEDGARVEAESVVSHLTGQTLAKALELKAGEVGDTAADQHEKLTQVALLEAFHRAVEGYLDDE